MAATPNPKATPAAARKKPVLSIRWIVAGAAAILTTLVVLGVTAVTERRTRAVLLEEMESRTLVEARNLALASTRALLTEYPELLLAPLVKEMTTRQPELAFIAVVDRSGTVHRKGVMRLATARDELVPLHDDRVRENPAYLTIALLGRVITRLGTLDEVHGGILENMFDSDVDFLQDLYRRVNQEGHTRASVTCPACNRDFTVDMAGGRLGES